MWWAPLGSSFLCEKRIPQEPGMPSSGVSAGLGHPGWLPHVAASRCGRGLGAQLRGRAGTSHSPPCDLSMSLGLLTPQGLSSMKKPSKYWRESPSLGTQTLSLALHSAGQSKSWGQQFPDREADSVSQGSVREWAAACNLPPRRLWGSPRRKKSPGSLCVHWS